MAQERVFLKNRTKLRQIHAKDRVSFRPATHGLAMFQRQIGNRAVQRLLGQSRREPGKLLPPEKWYEYLALSGDELLK